MKKYLYPFIAFVIIVFSISIARSSTLIQKAPFHYGDNESQTFGNTPESPDLEMYSTGINILNVLNNSATVKFKAANNQSNFFQFVDSSDNVRALFRYTGALETRWIYGRNDLTLYTQGGNNITLDPDGAGEIMLEDKTNVTGGISTDAFHFPTGAVSGYYLTVDSDGTTSWNALSVTSADIVDKTIDTIDIATNAIKNNEIATNAVDLVNMRNNSVDTDELVDDAATDAKVEDSITIGASGTVDDGALSSNVPLLDVSNTFNGDLFLNGNTRIYDWVNLRDDVELRIGSGNDAVFEYATTLTPDGLFLGVSSDNNSLTFGERADSAFDFSHAAQANPTLFIHSTNQSTDEWISITHDSVDGVISAGLGDIRFLTNIKSDSTVITNGFQMPIGAVNGYVLTTDGDGTATWQAAAGGVSSLAVGDSIDCGFSISGTTLTIGKTGANDCKVGVASSTAGAIPETVTFSSGVEVTFGVSSDTDGNTFGVELNSIGGGGWDEVAPMFVGVIDNSSDSLFVLMRNLVGVSGSNTTDLCQFGDTDCDGEQDIMLAASGETLADWTSKPITYVGSLLFTLNESGQYTFTLGNNSGFNDRVFGKWYVMPDSVNITADSTNQYMADVGANDAMICSENIVRYSPTRDGKCFYEFKLDNPYEFATNIFDYTNRVKLSMPYSYKGSMQAVTVNSYLRVNSGAPPRDAKIVLIPDENHFELSNGRVIGTEQVYNIIAPNDDEFARIALADFNTSSSSDHFITAIFEFKCFE